MEDKNINNNLNVEKDKIPKPVVLVVLDGWGIYEDYAGNAISKANTPNIDKLITEYPSMTLRAS